MNCGVLNTDILLKHNAVDRSKMKNTTTKLPKYVTAVAALDTENFLEIIPTSTPY